MKPTFFEMELYLQASSDRVWAALVEPSMASRYYIAPLWKIEAKVGGTINYGNEKLPVIAGRILRCESLVCLSHTFRFVLPGAKSEETTVTYTLDAPGANITHLHLRHEGFAEHSAIYDDIAGGWPTILSSLKTYLETGRPLEWPETSA